jgi:hypothetical protein
VNHPRHQYQEAEPLLLEDYKGMVARKDRIEVADRYHLDCARKWIVQLCQDWVSRRRQPSGRKSEKK